MVEMISTNGHRGSSSQSPGSTSDADRNLASRVWVASALGLAAISVMLGGSLLFVGWDFDGPAVPHDVAQFLSAEYCAAIGFVVSGVALATAALINARSASRRVRAGQDEDNAAERDGTMQCNEERYRMLVKSMATFFEVGDVSGGISTFQEGWHQYTGQMWEEQQGDGWIHAIHPDDRQRILHLWRRTVETSSSTHVEYRLWHAASQCYHFCESTAVPLLNSDGTVREWISAVRDIDDQMYRAAQSLQGDAPSQRSAESCTAVSNGSFRDRDRAGEGSAGVQKVAHVAVWATVESPEHGLSIPE